MSADYACVQKAGDRRDGLRRVLEAIGRDPCFLEYATFDIAGNHFRIAFRFLGLAVVAQIIRPETLQRHMRSPTVIPAFEFGAQKRQVVNSLNDRHSLKPLVLESLDDSLCHSDGAVFSYGSQAGLIGVICKPRQHFLKNQKEVIDG